MPGGIVTREFALDGFDAIRAERFDIEITQSNSFRVVVRTDEREMRRVSVRTSGRTLVLSTRRGWRLFGPLTLEATIEMPMLKSLELAGATVATLGGFRGMSDFDCELNGASELRGELQANTARFTAFGASRVRLTGKAARLSIRAEGASTLDLDGMAVETADVDLSGASSARLHVTSVIKAITASGASQLRYSGDPRIDRMETSGASQVAHA
jgi:hypothetical protein